MDLLTMEKYLSSLNAWRRHHLHGESGVVLASSLESLEHLAEQADRDLPGVLPAFDATQFLGRWSSVFGRYDAVAISTWLDVAMASLETTRQQTHVPPRIEQMNLAFIRDEKLRKVLDRDALELQLVFHAKGWKSTIILAGGVIEGILTDLLLHCPEAAKAKCAPRKSDITRWTLHEMLSVALELNQVQPAVGRLSHSVREYRNLIHPGMEIRENLTFGSEEAEIALQVLQILIREMGSGLVGP
jgi:hypothetical protein